MANTINSDKRKAIYIVEEDKEHELIRVAQKRPKIKDRDEFRPFWPDFDSAESAMDKLIAKNKVTLYRIKDNKVESFRVRRIPVDPNTFTSREQAKDVLESITESLDYTITRGTISVFYDDKSYTVTASDKRYARLRKCCIKNDIPQILKILNLKAQVKDTLGIKDNKITLSGHEIPKNLSKSIIDTIKIGDSKSITNFKKRLSKNSSKTAQKHLLEFLNYNEASLLDDGRILAYKYVKSDYKDCHTGRFDYSPGKIVNMNRKDVVEDPTIACAAGLHVGTWGYSGSHSNVLLCVIDPEDVVSVPYDYGYKKIRCCKVKSIRKITEPLSKLVYPKSFID